MSSTEERREARDRLRRLVRDYMRLHPDWGYKRIAADLGYTPESKDYILMQSRIQRAVEWNRAQDEDLESGNSELGRESMRDETSWGDKGATRTIDSTSFTLKNPEEVCAHCGVDMSVWKIAKQKISTSQVAARYRDQSLEWDAGIMTGYAVRRPEWDTTTLFHVSVTLVEKKPEQRAMELILEEMKKHAPEPKVPRWKKKPRGKLPKTKYLFVPCLYDLHLAALAWAVETGQNWDIKIACKAHQYALADLVHRVGGYQIERILYVIGNDFFHVNAEDNKTKLGTSQDVDGRLAMALFRGCDIVKAGLLMLRDIAPIDIVLIPGNHSPEQELTLAMYLEGRFHDDPHVNVDFTPKKRKGYVHGSVFLGLTHGERIKEERLAMLYLTDPAWKVDIANARRAEIFRGHLHTGGSVEFGNYEVHSGIGVRRVPSIVATNKWHYDMGYCNNIRVAQGYLVNPKGNVDGPFETSLDLTEKAEIAASS